MKRRKNEFLVIIDFFLSSDSTVAISLFLLDRSKFHYFPLVNRTYLDTKNILINAEFPRMQLSWRKFIPIVFSIFFLSISSAGKFNLNQGCGNFWIFTNHVQVFVVFVTQCQQQRCGDKVKSICLINSILSSAN